MIQDLVTPAKASAKVRFAKLPDLDGLMRLERFFSEADRFSEDSWRHLLNSKNFVLVLERDCEIIAAAAVLRRVNSRAGRLYSINVDPAYQGQGMGRKLLDAACKLLISKGFDRLTLEVRESNGTARNFYETSNFKPVRTLPAYYSDGEDGMKYERLLNAAPAPGS